jgi:hypothetical protein
MNMTFGLCLSLLSWLRGGTEIHPGAPFFFQIFSVHY